jgi:hypothetical protein
MNLLLFIYFLIMAYPNTLNHQNPYINLDYNSFPPYYLLLYLRNQMIIIQMLFIIFLNFFQIFYRSKNYFQIFR